MLSEHFVASIQTQLKTPASGFKDVGIILNELQPLSGARQSFKKSATAQNCLAVSDTHVFAAQVEKAVVHVYNRDRGNHEATIPLNEKITSLAIAASGFVLLLGTEGGRVLAWELATGRLITTSQSHLQAVTSLAIDPSSNFLLSGSRDSNVLVWSLSDILSFTNSDATGQSGPASPIHSLSSHRGPITDLKIGHGHSQANIAVSTSEDQSAIVWNYSKGIALRTYLLHSVPRALALDVGDRGFYTTYDDGSVQLIDFHAGSHNVNSLYDEKATAPVQPGELHTWRAEGQELEAGLSLAISWDGTRLLSGHKSGKIASWDVSKGSFMAVIENLPGTVSNLAMLPIQGKLKELIDPMKLADVVKPRIVTSEANGLIPGDYSFYLQIQADATSRSRYDAEADRPLLQSSFRQALLSPSLPLSFLQAGILELADNSAVCMEEKTHSNGTSSGGDANQKELAELKVQNDQLAQQIAHLQKLQKASFAQLRDKTRAISALAKEQEQIAEIAKHEHGWNITDANVEWNLFQQRRSKDVQ